MCSTSLASSATWLIGWSTWWFRRKQTPIMPGERPEALRQHLAQPAAEQGPPRKAGQGTEMRQEPHVGIPMDVLQAE